MANVTLYYKNKDGSIATNTVMDSDKSYWLSQGWSTSSPTSAPAPTSVAAPIKTPTPAPAPAPAQKATVFNPQTGERKVVTVGDPNAFAGGFALETPTDNYQIRKKNAAPAPAAPTKATVFNPQTGDRKAVTVGDPNAFAGGFVLETPTDSYQIRQQNAGGKTPEELAKEKAVAEANANAQSIFDEYNGKDIDVRESTKLITDLETKLAKSLTDETAAPAAPSMAATLAEQRTKLGLEPLETKLASIDSEIDAINTNLSIEAQKAGEQLVSMREINRKKGKLQTEAEQRIQLLQTERNAVARQVSNKMDSLDLIMKATGVDYQNATDAYDRDLTRTTTALNLMSGIEEREKSNAEKIVDDARANLQIMYNALQSGGVEFDSLTSDQKTKIQKMEMMAGLPIGLSQTLKNKNPKGEILSSSTRQAPDGKKYSDFVMKNADGSISVQSVFLGQERLPASGGGGGDKLTEAELLRAARSRVSPQLKAVAGADGHVSPENYRIAKNAWVNSGLASEDFDKSFELYVNMDYREEYGVYN